MMNENPAPEQLSARPPPASGHLPDMFTPALGSPNPLAHSAPQIRIAGTRFEHAVAEQLVRLRYERRGYATATFARTFGAPNRSTLITWQGGMAVATLTVGRDSKDGLLADTLYRPEIDRLRDLGRIVCEASALATHPAFRSTEMLIALFDLALHHSRDVWWGSDAVMILPRSHLRD